MAATAAPGAGSRLQSFVSNLVIKPWFWAFFILVIIAGPVGRALGREVPKPPAMKLPLPAFTLTNERGEAFGSEELKGRIWVADFVFTSCPTVCPKLTKRMLQIQRRAKNLGEAFHLVTFTVDPENDTPERLAVYAKANQADARRWTFLTGKLGDVETTVVKGFRLAMGKDELPEGSGLFSIFHGEKLVLVDEVGNIRGYFDADDEGIQKLLSTMSILVNVR